MRTCCILLAALLLLPATAEAGLYKCTKDGHTAYQDKPCDKGSASKELSADTGVGGGLKGFPWTALTYGMSVKQVEAEIPGLVPGSLKNIGLSKALLMLKGLSAEGFNFEANFYFMNRRYQYVSLESHINKPAEELKSRYDGIYANLVAEYGQPSFHKDNSDILTRRYSSWNLKQGQLGFRVYSYGPKTQVELLFFAKNH